MKTNTHHTKYRIINNICPYQGVTVNQLLDQCNYLIKTMKESLQLDTIEQQTVINDAVLFVYQKMEEGKVDKYDYSKFKGYLFIALKNEVLKSIISKDFKKNQVFAKTTVEIEDLDESQHQTLELDEGDDDDKKRQKQIFKSVLQTFNEIEQYIITTEDTYRMIMANHTDYNKQRIANLRRSFKTKCQKLYNTTTNKQIQFQKPIKKIERKPKIKMKEQIMELLHQGYSKSQIARQLRCAKTLVIYHTNDSYNEKVKERNNKYYQNSKNENN